MTLNFKEILHNITIQMFDNNAIFYLIVLVLSILILIFRHEIGSLLQNSKREQNKLLEIALLSFVTIGSAGIAYIYFKGYLFWLSLVLSILTTYLLYLVGLVDVMVRKLEDRYGW